MSHWPRARDDNYKHIIRCKHENVSNVFLIWPPANQIHVNVEIPTDFDAVYHWKKNNIFMETNTNPQTAINNTQNEEGEEKTKEKKIKTNYVIQLSCWTISVSKKEVICGNQEEKEKKIQSYFGMSF